MEPNRNLRKEFKWLKRGTSGREIHRILNTIPDRTSTNPVRRGRDIQPLHIYSQVGEPALRQYVDEGGRVESRVGFGRDMSSTSWRRISMGSFPILCLDDIHLIYTELLMGAYSAGTSPPPAETGGISRSSGGGCVYKFDGQVITPFVRSRVSAIHAQERVNSGYTDITRSYISPGVKGSLARVANGPRTTRFTQSTQKAPWGEDINEFTRLGVDDWDFPRSA